MSANLASRSERALALSPGTSRRNTVLWLLFASFLALYAVLVVQAGFHNLPFNTGPDAAAKLAAIQAQGDKKVPYSEVAEAAREVYPWWNQIMAKVGGTYYGYGSNGGTEPLRYYASMDATEKSVLSVHMALGGACLVLGVFQFWPAFRRNYRKAHRALGGLYILSAYTMVAASAYHLLHTRIEDTFQGFTFHLQLWFLVISTTITQTLAIYHIKKRNFALHFGFQAYTFAAFLSAPLQRLDWVILGAVWPHLTLGEVNNMVNLAGFWQCLLAAYVIYVWNRETSPLRPQMAVQPAKGAGEVRFFWALALAGATTTVALFLVWPGLGHWSVARSIVPASTLAAEAALFADRTLQNLVFSAATCAAILSGMWLLMNDAANRRARNIFYVGAVISGLIQLSWGWQLGEPSLKVIAGGGFYTISGISLLGFALVALWAERRGREAWWRELMVYGVNFAFAPALLLWMHAIWYALGVVPQRYVDIGHAYILAAGGAILSPTLHGLFGAFTSTETRSRAIN
jgi:hypothetical protein